MMDLDEMAAELDRLGVDPSRYSLVGGTPEDGFAVMREGRHWRVYYSERGQRSTIATHESEDRACQHLLELLTADP